MKLKIYDDDRNNNKNNNNNYCPLWPKINKIKLNSNKNINKKMKKNER